jgi:hypothetical protein
MSWRGVTERIASVEFSDDPLSLARSLAPWTRVNPQSVSVNVGPVPVTRQFHYCPVPGTSPGLS